MIDNTANEQIDKAIVAKKEQIKLDSFEIILPASRYQLLEISELEQLTTDLKQAQQRKLNIIASPALFDAEARLHAVVDLNAININIAGIAFTVALYGLEHEEA